MGLPKLLNYLNFTKKSTDSNPTTYADMLRLFNNHGALHEALVNTVLWQPSTAYSVGAEVKSPSLSAGCVARCTKAGTTGASEPSWTAAGTTITDGTATWSINNAEASASSAMAAKSSLTLPDVSTDSLIYKILKKVLDASGAEYVLAINGYIDFGALFGHVTIQWGKYNGDNYEKFGDNYAAKPPKWFNSGGWIYPLITTQSGENDNFISLGNHGCVFADTSFRIIVYLCVKY